MENITAIIITKNEEVNIVDCLKSIKAFCNRIIVVDSGSSDNTVNLAKGLGAETYYHPFETHAKQRNWAIDNLNITSKWILRLDADERLTPALCDELSCLMKAHDEDDINGITLDTILYFMNKPIKHGGHVKRKLMLFKTGKGRIEDRRMDEHTILLSGKSICAKNKYIHYDFKDMSTWINKLNWYATLETLDYFDFVNGKNSILDKNQDPTIARIRKKKFGFYYKLPRFFRCKLLFIYFYIFKFGFLDGQEGFIYHWTYHRFYRTLVDSKITEQIIATKKRKK